MTNPSPAPPKSTLNFADVVWILFVVFFLLSPFLQSFFPSSNDDIEMELVDARVTDILEKRRRFTYYLDGNVDKEYDLNSFESANPAIRRKTDNAPNLTPEDLSHYLRRNDRLTKVANSPLLVVHRGSIVTLWILYSATPESKIPAKECPFITHGAYKTAP